MIQTIYAQFLCQSQRHCRIKKSGGFCSPIWWETAVRRHPGKVVNTLYSLLQFASSEDFVPELRLYCWASAMWQRACPAPAKRSSPWLSPAHMLFSQTEPVITSCTTCLDSRGPSATPITKPFTSYRFILAVRQGNQQRRYFFLDLKNMISFLRYQKATGVTCQSNPSPWAVSQPCPRLFHPSIQITLI